MIFVTWRTQRAQILAVGALVLFAVVYLLITGDHIAAVNGAVERCRSASSFCRSVDARQAGDHNLQLFGDGLLYLLPCFVGLFVGSPILARELADGTSRLAFTQSVSRRRWLTWQLAVGAAVVTGALAVLVPVAAVWSHDIGSASLRIVPVEFEMGGVVLVGYGLGAFGIGAALGGLVRRQAWAFAAAAAVVALLRYAVHSSVRTHLQPLVAAVAPVRGPGINYFARGGGWIVNAGFARAGSTRLLSSSNHLVLSYYDCFTRLGVRRDPCPVAAHLRNVVLYHPASQYWPMQLLEAGLFAAIAATLCVVLTTALSRLWVAP